MSIFLILCGITLIIIGIVQKKFNIKFNHYYETAVHEISNESYVENIHNVLARIDILEARMNKYCENGMIDYEKIVKTFDFENKSVDDLTQLTGMKKGEVLLIKRIIQG